MVTSLLISSQGNGPVSLPVWLLSSKGMGSSWFVIGNRPGCALCSLHFVSISSTGTCALCHPITEEDGEGYSLCSGWKTHSVMCYSCSNTAAQSHGHYLEIRVWSWQFILMSGSQVTMQRWKENLSARRSVEWQLAHMVPSWWGSLECPGLSARQTGLNLYSCLPPYRLWWWWPEQ